MVSFESDSEADLTAKDAQISALLLQINELHMSQGKVAFLEKEMAGRDVKHAAAIALKVCVEFSLARRSGIRTDKQIRVHKNTPTLTLKGTSTGQ